MQIAHDVTVLLNASSRGDQDALGRLLPLVYEELRTLAGRHMQGERSDHTLQPTALANEAYLRLVGQREVDWRGRAQFFALAAQAMRRILVDHARRHAADKRGGDYRRVDMDVVDSLDLQDQAVNLLEIHNALARFSTIDPQAGRVVELRFFGGLTVEETAAVMDISERTVKRDWRAARAWLARELGDIATT